MDVEKLITILMMLIIEPGAASGSWSVTFETPDLCAAKGTSVEFKCSYNYTAGETVSGTAWQKGQLVSRKWIRRSLSELPSYDNRVEDLGDLRHNCTVAVHDLREEDSGYYYFSFNTNKFGRRSKKSVFLTVSEINITVQPKQVRAGDLVSLRCETSCRHLGTVWFKDGRPGAREEFLAQMGDTGRYSCAVEGQESVRSEAVTLDVQYPPLNVSIKVTPSDGPSAGSSVNLTCSAAANPPADSYIWYKLTSFVDASSPLQVGEGRTLALGAANASHAGLYLCRAGNSVGTSNSTEVLLSLEAADGTSSVHTIILLAGIGVKGLLLLFFPLLVLLVCRRRDKPAVDEEDASNDYENFLSS